MADAEQAAQLEAAHQACARWGLPTQGGDDAGARAVEAIPRVDDALGVLFPEQRERLNEIVQRQQAGGGIDPRDGAFLFGLTMQCGYAVSADAQSGGVA